MNINTKIIATIGPATLSIDIFQQIINQGIDFIRINTSYGNTVQYDQILTNLNHAKTTKPIIPILDIKNLDVLAYAKDNHIKHIALSFTETADQITKIRQAIPQAFIISKIETRKGVENFDQILDHSDGIMIARGDLGEAVSLPEVPPLQKYFTEKTINKQKMVVAATEMLLSMTEKPKPTHAEVSDVANAVFDRATAVMLSEETAIGKYPIESVSYMRKIIKEAEDWNTTHTIELSEL